MPKATRKKVARRRTKSSGVTLPTTPKVVGQSPRELISMFFGPPGVGKTSFVNALGRVLFISTDRGTRTMSAMAQEVHTWDDITAVVTALEVPGAANEYDYICLDHIDDMCAMADDWTCDKLEITGLAEADWGNGWKTYKKEIRALIGRLSALNTGLVMIAHEQIKTIRTRTIELERTTPAMGKAPYNLIIPLCDIVGYMGFRTVKQGGQRTEIRTLETTPREDLYVKDRSERTRPGRGYDILAEPPKGAADFLETFIGSQEGNHKQGTRRKSARRKRVQR